MTRHNERVSNTTTQNVHVPEFLLKTLTLPRPAHHELEEQFVNAVLRPAIADAVKQAYLKLEQVQTTAAGRVWEDTQALYSTQTDGYGNIWVKYNRAAPNCPKEGEMTLITSHTDTANSYRYSTRAPAKTLTGNTVTNKTLTHSVDKLTAYPQVVPKPTEQSVIAILDNADTYLWLDTSKPTCGCMGADDGAGMALALAMIEAGKPYDFVFYRAEEVGGRGSSWSADNNKDWYKSYARAIAFDRRGTTDVITHQGMRCASDEFGQALAALLNAGNKRFTYKPSPNGIFTDTANLTDDVPECTNISVGYANEHSLEEELNLTHWLALRDVITSPGCDFNTLPTKRDPSERDYGLYGKWFGKHDPYDDYDYSYKAAERGNRKYDGYEAAYTVVDEMFDGLSDADWVDYIRDEGEQAASDLIWYDPDKAARLLAALARD